MDPVGLLLPRPLRPFANACLCYTEVSWGFVCWNWHVDTDTGGGGLLSHVYNDADVFLV